MATRAEIAAVKLAIANFVPRRGFQVVKKRDNESSFIFQWGVRVQQIGTQGDDQETDQDVGDVELARDDLPDDEPGVSDPNSPTATAGTTTKRAVGWICLMEHQCRKNQKIIALPRGFTSKATAHLKSHQITSNKTQTEVGNKRKYADEFEKLQKSQLYRDDPTRLVILLETRRIVLNNLPFKFAEYTETMLINQLTAKPDFQTHISINDVRHAIVEMYATTKNEVLHYLKDNKPHVMNSMSLVVDFWTSPVKKTKFLGIRVYLVDKQWKYQSVLLGTREFCPTYNECEGGRASAFERWITETLLDFGLTTKDFFGSTTDGGPDVKKMMQTTLNLKWQWCIPHLSNTVTKTACGMHTSKDKKKTKNAGMLEVIRLMTRTIYIVMSNEKMGSLWKDLCQMLGRDYRPPREHPGFDEETKGGEDDDKDESETEDVFFVEEMAPRDGASHRNNKATKLLNFQSHRFMGLVRVLRRLLERWGALKEWFGEVAAKAAREKRPTPYTFPLKKHNKVLVQLLSLLEPISRLNQMAQAESANQADVLLELYVLRLDVLDQSQPLPHYLSTPEKPRVIDVVDLKPVVLRTRKLLFQGFEQRFFSRYLREPKDRLKAEPFIMEMQLFLDPRYKVWDTSLEQVVRVCNIQAGEETSQVEAQVERVSRAVQGRVRAMMTAMATIRASPEAPSPAPDPSHQRAAGVARHHARFERRGSTPATRTQTEIDRAEDEVGKWIDDEDNMQELPSKRIETILEFWQRKERDAGYEYLPKIVKILYSAPTSSAQIERDFGMSGMMVTSTRSRLSAANIDMCSFLKANKSFLDVTQVGALKKKDAELQKPRVSLVELTSMIDANVHSLLNNAFSSIELTDDQYSEDLYGF